MKLKLRTIIPDSTNHPKQLAFINSKSKRIIVRAGRRGGKTVCGFNKSNKKISPIGEKSS
jgi:hypothetical protein